MVFVTGATGLVGSHLLYFLRKAGEQVLALRRKNSSWEKVRTVFERFPEGTTYWDGIEWVEGDVLEPATLIEPIRRVDKVYHCAAVVSFAGGDKGRIAETNRKGTEHISRLCREHGVRLCYVSSIAALGDARVPSEVIHEDTPAIPGREHSAYSQSKREAEEIVWEEIRRGLNAVIACPSIILGVAPEKRSSTQLYATIARGVPFYTRGISGYVDVRDVCELLIRLANDDIQGERFILNGGNYSYQELFTAIARANGKRPPRWYMAPWMTDVAWRLLATGGKLTGKKPAFTKETARSAHHQSYYSNAKILNRYPDFHFYTLTETVQHIRLNSINA